MAIVETVETVEIVVARASVIVAESALFAHT
jgi:hypothetical protein